MAEIGFTYLNGPDIAALEMGDQEILDAVEVGLRAQGEGQTVIEPRVHLEPDPAFRGHFNVLRGYATKRSARSSEIYAHPKIPCTTWANRPCWLRRARGR